MEDEKRIVADFERELKNRPELVNDPGRLGSLIVRTLSELENADKALEKHKNALAEIKSRGFWRRIFRNNIKDLAGNSEEMAAVIGSQNKAVLSFFQILRSVIFLNITNMKFLVRLSEEIKAQSHSLHIEDSTLFDIAASFLDESIKSIEYQDERLQASESAVNARMAKLEETLEKQGRDLAALEAEVSRLKLKKRFLSNRFALWFMMIANAALICFILAYFFRKL
jgi:DNA repair exonuclease SbcCD ATPase subunit